MAELSWPVEAFIEQQTLLWSSALRCGAGYIYLLVR